VERTSSHEVERDVKVASSFGSEGLADLPGGRREATSPSMLEKGLNLLRLLMYKGDDLVVPEEGSAKA
jgi:hypothetical protein